LDLPKYKIGKGISSWRYKAPYNITFVVTEDCNLRCKYCYQVHKNNKKAMSLDMAKQAVDFFLDNPDLFNADAVIWEFIGGEPLLEMDLINQITDYIKIQTYKKNHPWFNAYRFSISSNGTLYHKDNVRRFIKKNPKKFNVGISIDGTKAKHDLQRVYVNGRGSYDDVAKNIPLWLEEMPDAITKVTIGHEDIPYLKESIVHLWNLGIKNVPANVVFEDVWQEGDDVLFENQLRELADYILEHRLWNEVDCSLFDEKLGYPNNDESLDRNHCGSGRMIAVDADGNFYPCLRYMDYSLTNEKPYLIGNIRDGIDFDKIRPFLALNARTQSDEECLDCEVAGGCAWCQANNYDLSGSGTNYRRAKYICQMHKARCRANNYYWGRLEKDCGIKKEIIGTPRKRYLYFIMADDAVEHCNYQSRPIGGSPMSEDILSQAFKFAEEYFFTPVILHSKNNVLADLNSFSKNERIEIVSYDKKELLKAPGRTISVFEHGVLKNTGSENDNCILTLDESHIFDLAKDVKQLLPDNSRININLYISSNEFNLEAYEEQLRQIIDLLVPYYKTGQIKEVNVLTDRIFLNKMDNCEAGNYNYAVAPNGKIYICPAFYFADPNSAVGSLGEGISVNRALFELKNAPYCSQCDAFHCSRCVFLNKTRTNEFNIPSSLQCKKSHLERKMSLLLADKMRDEEVHLPESLNLSELSYADPVDLIISKLEFNPYNLKNC